MLRGAVLAAAGFGLGVLPAGCGHSSDPLTDEASVPVKRALPEEAGLAGAATLVTAFGADLYQRAVAGAGGNAVLSPYSVAVALAMSRAGAAGRTATELDTVLHAAAAGSGQDALSLGLNALAQHFDGLAGTRSSADGRRTDKVVLTAANSLWGQPGENWQRPFLTTLARYYGAGMQLADFTADPARAAKMINSWTSERTGGTIPRLLQAGDIDALTRLVLVNALHLKAPWEQPFDKAAPAPFTRADGSLVQTPLMTATLPNAGYATGVGWQAADLPYLGRELAMAVIVPDRGRFAAVEAALDGAALRRLLTGFRAGGLELTMPRWTFRTHLMLNQTLAALGMPTAFTDAADFSGMTTSEGLHIGAVVHEAYVAVDEQGTQAAAATAVVVEAAAAVLPSRVLTVDRPFLFVLHDVRSATPLFLGRVMDPTAG